MNGGGPYLLARSAYDIIKAGVCVTSGDYSGCIKVGSVHYWLAVEAPVWSLHTGVPDDKVIVYMTEDVWDRCKENGTYSWGPRAEYWTDSGNNYRWGGYAADDVELMEL